MGEADRTWSAAELARALEQFPPTEEQTRVIEAPLAPMLVIAGAGSGKTETMAAKVVYLVANRLVAPEHVLGLTFTRKAAAELSDRIRARLRTVAALDPGIDLASPPRIATYNSYAAGIVADHGLRLGVDPESVLISDAGRYQLAERVVNAWEGDLETDLAATSLTRAVAALAAEISEHGLRTADVREFLTRLISEVESKEPAPRSKQPRSEIRTYLSRWRTRIDLMDLVDAFARAKRERGVVDFGDQVRFAADLAARVPLVGKAERDAYHVVLLDEYQDTSIAQVQLLSALFGAGSGHPVTAVGDPNQAIYGWRGAAAGTLLEFPRQFRSGQEDAAVATLSTAWRNARDVLQIANKVAAPLRGESAVAVPPLAAREGAPGGNVEVYYGQTIDEEAARIVAYLRERGWPGSAPPTTALLVRTRKTFAPISRALTAAGIAHQITGLGGLLSTPEVADLWAALTVVHDPSRADALIRLLTGQTMRIGPQDLQVLSAWAKELARNRRPGAGEPAGGGREDVETASIVEALEHLPPPHYSPRGTGNRLSEDARHRLNRLAGKLRTIRDLTQLPLPDLLAAAEHTLGLDIEVLAHRPEHSARHNLDEFAAVAASFTSGVDEANLGGFLAWLDAAEEHERGLSLTEVEPDPAAVQLMTIHAAKGLEWDAVIVAGMGEGLFPTLEPNKHGKRLSTGWLRAVDLLPYELRGDAANLPSFDHEQALTHADMRWVDEEFRAEEGERLLREERRLAYVALTRAKTHLLLTGSFWVPGRTHPYPPSIFLGEATRAGVDLPDLPLAPESEENPLGEDGEPVQWPPPHRPRTPALPPAEEPELTHPAEETDEVIGQWYRQARLLLAERDAAWRAPQQTVVEHLSASRVVAAARDPEEFTLNLRRPVPSQPSARARKGTEFHAWVEQHFNAPALVDWHLLPGADDDAAEADLEALREAFLSSPWARRQPIALEADVETTIAGVRVRSRIDAVFSEPDGAFHVVDWKTGRAPRTAEEQRVRMVQLLLYRLAWARAQGIEVAQVRASFYYVGEDVTVAAPDLSETEILEEITAHLADVTGEETGEETGEAPGGPVGAG